MSAGLVPAHAGSQDSRAAHASTGLHSVTPRVVREDRYAMPVKPYVYGMSDPALSPYHVTARVSRNR